MQNQLTFDLPSRPALGRDDFFVSPANSLAVETVHDVSAWPGHKLILNGAAGSGKTHLVHVWASETGAKVLSATEVTEELVPDLAATSHIAVEDIDAIAGQIGREKVLFHLHNAVLANEGFLLLTTAKPPAACNFALPDLASRLQATSIATLQPADDTLLAALLVKLFSDRQLAIDPKIITFLVSHMDRSFDCAHQLVAALDAAALQERRSVTKPLAMRVLKAVLSEES